MLSEISAAIATLKGMGEVVGLLLKMRGDNEPVGAKVRELNVALFELQQHLLSVQHDHDAMINSKRELEERVRQMEKWETESKRYELKEIAPGVFAYALKGATASVGPKPWFCAHCYQNKQISILQRQVQVDDGIPYGCPACRTLFIDHAHPIPLVF